MPSLKGQKIAEVSNLWPLEVYVEQKWAACRRKQQQGKLLLLLQVSLGDC